MNTNFNEFEKVEESMHIASKIKLRDSIHSVVMEHLDPGEQMEVIELSKKLKEKFNINISNKVLEELLFIMWWRKDDYTIFREKDKKWLDVWPWKKTIERKKRVKDPPLGKSRRKVLKEEEEEKRKANNPYYGRTYPNTNVNRLNNTGNKFNWRDNFFM